MAALVLGSKAAASFASVNSVELVVEPTEAQVAAVGAAATIGAAAASAAVQDVLVGLVVPVGPTTLVESCPLEASVVPALGSAAAPAPTVATVLVAAATSAAHPVVAMLEAPVARRLLSRLLLLAHRFWNRM